MRTPSPPAAGLASSIYRIPFPGQRDARPAKEIVGSKALNLMRMAAAGLPVPPAFVIGTDICKDYLERGSDALTGLESVLDNELAWLGAQSGRHVGDARRPLLVSVRSGAAISMPGMMETVLNIGLNAATADGLVRMTGNPRLAADCRRRLVQQYGEVVGRIAPSVFSDCQRLCLDAVGAADVDELDTAGLTQLAEAFERAFEEQTGHRLPSDPLKQTRAAVEAVLQSWSSDRAKAYRTINRIPDTLGTAVTIQAMVFGNMGPSSGSGVGFTRNPASGKNELYVDYLANAQGEDVVAGRRTALGVNDMQRRSPAAYEALLEARIALEREFRDMQDFEFTVEEGRLLFLQARAGKRTPLAALQIAHDLVNEGLITPAGGLAQLQGLDLQSIEQARLKIPAGTLPLTRGTSAGSGVAVGRAAFDAGRAAALSHEGEPAILVRETAETSEIEAMAAAAALVTVEGARTSHAAVVARQLGKPCIVGCHAIAIDPSLRHATVDGREVREGDVVSLDGSTGEIYSGALDTIEERPAALLEAVKTWGSHQEPSAGGVKKRRVKVVAGADAVAKD